MAYRTRSSGFGFVCIYASIRTGFVLRLKLAEQMSAQAQVQRLAQPGHGIITDDQRVFMAIPRRD